MLITLWLALKKSALRFLSVNAIKFSASLSYYTIFALPPMLLIVFGITGFFYGEEAIQGKVYGQISGIVGSSVAMQIEHFIQNIHLSGGSVFATTASIITLIFSSTAIFAEIQDSINIIWRIKARPRKEWLKWLKNRLLSFSMIVTLGFLLLVSLVISTLLDLLLARLQYILVGIPIQLFFVLNFALVFSVITFLFAIIFKFLPDGFVKWKDALRGASFTAILFMIGKFLIGFYLNNSSLTSIYGAVESVIIILLWVYYSSIILYFGAIFTLVYANLYGSKIFPKEYAVFIRQEEIEYTGSTKKQAGAESLG